MRRAFAVSIPLAYAGLASAAGRLAELGDSHTMMHGRNHGADNAGRIRRLEPSPDVVGQRLGEEVVLVNLETNRIFELNRTGGRFWELLQGEPDRVQLEQQLRSEFDVSEAILAAEVDGLVEALAAEDLVRVLERD